LRFHLRPPSRFGTVFEVRQSSAIARSFPIDLVSFTRSGDGFSSLFVGRPPAFSFALVPELLAFGQSQLDLHPAVLEVHPGGNQSKSLLLSLADQLPYFLFMHQQLTST